MSAQTLRLEIAEFTDVNHWRWVLKDASGAFLADRVVELDPSEAKYRALFDLPGYLWHHASPDKRDADEQVLLQEVGEWIGTALIGQTIREKILAHSFSPIIVRVVVPKAAEQLLLIPLDIAYASGKPLVLQGVSFVFDMPHETPPPAAPIGDRLRLLALFSLPPEGSPLNLRRERQMLRRLVRQLTGAAGLAIELRVLQYGVTRVSLLEALEAGEGWDVIHFAGHGLPGSLVLESTEGRPDPIQSAEIAELLRLAGHRLKLVVLSACHSAASSIKQTLSWLGEPAAAHDNAAARTAPSTEGVEAFPTVARAIANTLDCAVLAMRYAVEDEFAIALSSALYDNMFRQGQSLPRATQRALTKALGDSCSAAGALSLATPALFGAKAAELELVLPRRPAGRFVVEETGLAYFPPEPEHFVGRVTAMTRASAALAAESHRSGVLIHGMAGAGKTSCAVELAYHHQAAARFQAFVWYRAPEPDKDIALALRDFALSMERQLPGFTMVHSVDTVETLRHWLPRLSEMLAGKAILVVLDNLESLLTASGQWRDERWGLLIDALLTPGGLSRALLTSRIRPAHLPASAEVLPIDALTRDEALLLVRELPNLRRFLDGKRTGTPIENGRELVHRTLRLVQGHPKLIEFAENLAADPQHLKAQLERADATKGSGELDTFFREGETSFDAAAFATCLRNWTTGIAATLPEPERIFFHFLCSLEEGDRYSQIIEATWPNLLKGLSQSEAAADFADVLTPLVVAGLVEKKAIGDDGKAFEVLVHPAVAEAGRAEAGPAFQVAVDAELSAVWRTGMQQGIEQYEKRSEAGKLIIHAGLSAFPYLSRRQEWDTASWMLEWVDHVDDAPATVIAVLRRLRDVAAATVGTERELIDRGILARLLRKIGRVAEAEAELRAILAHAIDRGEYGMAATAASDLVNLLRDGGRLDQALRVIQEMEKHTRRAGHGHWAQLANEAQQLQILNLQGEHQAVLCRAMELLEQMRALPEAGPTSPIRTWQVRELIMEVAAAAAAKLTHWQQSLNLNAEVFRSRKQRGATPLDLAGAQFNDHFPLLRLRRFGEARDLLARCRSVFERENSVEMVGMVLSANADLENELGQPAIAQRFEENAIRYRYMVGNPDHIATSHFNLATYIINGEGERCDALGHRLAGVLIRAMMRQQLDRLSLAVLERDLRQTGPAGWATLPKDFAALCATVERVDGVRFRQLVDRFAANHVGGDRLMRQVLAAVKGYKSG
jgi:tetratricopeptide (TPR) repeat protein